MRGVNYCSSHVTIPSIAQMRFAALRALLWNGPEAVLRAFPLPGLSHRASPQILSELPLWPDGERNAVWADRILPELRPLRFGTR